MKLHFLGAAGEVTGSCFLVEAQAAMRAFRALDYDTEVPLFPGIRFRFRDAGHILGSAHVELWCKDGSQRRKRVFSGDIGHYGAPEASAALDEQLRQMGAHSRIPRRREAWTL